MADKKEGSAYSERSREFLGEEIRHHVKDKGMPQDQAVAAAMGEARRQGMKVPPEQGSGKGRGGPSKGRKGKGRRS